MAESFDVVFHGNSKSECTAFIRAVRQHAKDNGKIRDNQWIADELYNAFDGDALVWYTFLPADVRGDWDLLQQSLVTRWIKDADQNESASTPSPAIQPTPAAAAPAPYPPAPTEASPETKWARKVGRIRIRINGIQEVRYLSKNVMKEYWFKGAFGTTADAALALRVRFIMTAPNFYRSELVEHESNLSVLAAFSGIADNWSDASTHGILVAVDTPGQGPLKDRQTTFIEEGYKTKQCWTDAWQVENTGFLKLRGPGGTAETVRFAYVAGDTMPLLFQGSKAGTGWTDANIEFEPLDK